MPFKPVLLLICFLNVFSESLTYLTATYIIFAVCQKRWLVRKRIRNAGYGMMKVFYGEKKSKFGE